MQHTTHHSGRLGRTLAALAIGLILLLLFPAAAFAGRVFIDPGHGGRFPGAVYGGVTEAEINLAIARELDRILRAGEHSTALSRTANVEVTTRDIPTWSSSGGIMRYAANGTYNVYDDLQARCDLANAWGADIFVSIHANAAGSSSANGAETYWRNVSETDRILSQRLARYVQQEYVLETGLNDRGVKIGAFYVLRWSNMPAILIETGFMSNSSDLARLTDPAFQHRAAQGIARGIERFFAEDPFTPIYPRIAGSDRYDTAVRIAEAGWSPTGGTAILVSGTAWPDALTGTPLSRPMNAPVLLTQADALPEATRIRLESQSPTRIVVLGGSVVVSDAVVDAAVAATGRDPELVQVDRIWGSNRFETAEAIARRVKVPSSGRVIIASGHTYADALSIAPFAGEGRIPILLVEPDRVPEATRRFIADHGSSITEFEVVGGESAIGPAVVAELSLMAPVVRTAGSNRYATNVAVVNRYRPTGTIDPLVATGRRFPDALTASALASKGGRPVILVAGNRQLPAVTREFLVNNSSRTVDPTMIGGTSVLSLQMEWMVRKGLER